jgi:hypothetical protein
MLKSSATVARSPRWNAWRSSCLFLLKQSSTTSVHVPEVWLKEDSSVRCVVADGVYSALLISFECVMVVNRSVTLGRLLEACMNDGFNYEGFAVCIGYLKHDNFNVLSPHAVN